MSAIPKSAVQIDVWELVRREAEQVVLDEPALAEFIYSNVLHHRRLEEAVAFRIAGRLAAPHLPKETILRSFHEAIRSDPAITHALQVDLAAVLNRDPATTRLIFPLLHLKGFHALQAHRMTHWLWNNGRRDFALYLQSRSSAEFQTDIHPAAKIGCGVFLDHATGLVVGETSVIGDDVSIMQGVTLGGTGKHGGGRHPKIGRGVMIGSDAVILGNITIGHDVRIGAGSVVLESVPAHVTVAGSPARIVGQSRPRPSETMDQMINSSAS